MLRKELSFFFKFCMYFECSKELSRGNNTFENPQQMVCLRNKKKDSMCLDPHLN